MGYFCLHALHDIESLGAFWMSRLPASVSLRDRGGRTLREILRGSRRRRIDLKVTLGSRAPFPCRLVATRLSKERAAANRRHRRREAKRRGKTASKEGLLRDAWSLVVTNVPRESVPAAEVWDIYAQRWSIEIGFRAVKQSTNCRKALGHRSGEHHIKALVLAIALLMVLGMKAYSRLRAAPDEGGGVSLEKLCDAFAGYILKRNRDNLGEAFAPDPRHITHDKRSRLTLWQSVTAALG